MVAALASALSKRFPSRPLRYLNVTVVFKTTYSDLAIPQLEDEQEPDSTGN